MKKAQILSAIALAFALGVTPVIATVNTVSAYTVANADEGIKGSATQAEVNTAAAAVKSQYPTYNNMLTVRDLLALSGDKAVEKVDSLTKTTDIDPITTALLGLGIEQDKIDELTESDSFVDQIKSLAAEGKNIKNYGILANFWNAIFVTEDDAAYRAAVAAINAKYGTELAYNSNVTIDATKGSYAETIANAVNAKATGKDAELTYSNYYALFDAITDAEENESIYSANLKKVLNAFKADGVLNTAGQEALAQYLGTTANPAISSITSIAKNSSATLMNNYSAWLDVETAVTTAEKSAQNFANEYNYTLILNIAKALQVAVPVLDKTDSEIAQQLVNYKASEAQVTTIVSADGNVSVTGKFEAGKVFVKSSKSNKEVKAFDGKKSFIYDIVLVDVNGNEVKPEGEVTVAVKVQGDLNGAKSNIYYVTEDGKVSLVKSTYKDGVLTFTTNHFSLYAIVEDNGTNLTTPATGALFGTEGGASTTVAMVAGIATALTAAGAGVVAYRNARRSSRK